MIRLKPPAEGYRYNGAIVPPDGIEVLEADVAALVAAGWTKLEQPKPRKSKKELED